MQHGFFVLLKDHYEDISVHNILVPTNRILQIDPNIEFKENLLRFLLIMINESLSYQESCEDKITVKSNAHIYIDNTSASNNSATTTRTMNTRTATITAKTTENALNTDTTLSKIKVLPVKMPFYVQFIDHLHVLYIFFWK